MHQEDNETELSESELSADKPNIAVNHALTTNLQITKWSNCHHVP